MKKGMIYTIVIFLLASAIVELVSFNAEHQDRHAQFFQTAHPAQLAASHQDAIALSTLQALGISSSIERNSTNLNLYVHDEGFPLQDSSLGKAPLAGLKQFLEQNYSQKTGCQINYSAQDANASGKLLSTNFNLSYSHNNSASANDTAKLKIPQNYNISSIDAQLHCIRPHNYSYTLYQDWPATGTWRIANITYTDDGGSSHENFVPFNPSSDHFFSAQNYDSQDQWLSSLHFDLVEPNYTIRIWSEANNSYTPSLSKKNVSCSFNITIGLNYSPAERAGLNIPINTLISCPSAQFNSSLPISKN